MKNLFSGRTLLTLIVSAALIFSLAGESLADKKIKLRLASSGSATGTRAIALNKVFGPAVSEFAEFEGHWNSSLFKQGTELEAIARGNLEMALASAQELAVFFPEFSIFATGYVHRDAAHQVAVFNDPLMDPFKKKVEKELKMKLLSVVYLGRRQVNLRTDEKVMTPADLKGVNLRMPGTNAWQFLGKVLANRRHRRTGQPAAHRGRQEVLRGYQADRFDLAPGGFELPGHLHQNLEQADA